eukprot:1346367-Rhodomonas_salina.2
MAGQTLVSLCNGTQQSFLHKLRAGRTLFLHNTHPRRQHNHITSHDTLEGAATCQRTAPPPPFSAELLAADTLPRMTRPCLLNNAPPPSPSALFPRNNDSRTVTTPPSELTPPPSLPGSPDTTRNVSVRDNCVFTCSVAAELTLPHRHSRCVCNGSVQGFTVGSEQSSATTQRGRTALEAACVDLDRCFVRGHCTASQGIAVLKRRRGDLDVRVDGVGWVGSKVVCIDRSAAQSGRTAFERAVGHFEGAPENREGTAGTNSSRSFEG